MGEKKRNFDNKYVELNLLNFIDDYVFYSILSDVLNNDKIIFFLVFRYIV